MSSKRLAPIAFVVLAACSAPDGGSGAGATTAGKGDGASAEAQLRFGHDTIDRHLSSARGFLDAAPYFEFTQQLLLELIAQGAPRERFEAVYDVSSLEALRYHYALRFPDRDLDGLPPLAATRELLWLAFDHAKIIAPEELLLTELVAQRMIADPVDWRRSVAAVRNAIGFEAKIQLAAYLGGVFGAHYNHRRAEAIIFAGGPVSIETLLASVRDGVPGGVCRDVALAQTQILEALGVEAYVVAYATVGSAFHATVVTWDPHDPNTLVKLNYSFVSADDGPAGPGSLLQDTSLPDFGFNYRIYDARGRPVMQLPADLGRFLDEAFGRTRHPFDVEDGTDFRALEAAVGEGDTIFRLVYGQSARGETIAGLASQRRFALGGGGVLTLGLAEYQRRAERTHLAFDQAGFATELAIGIEQQTPAIPLAGGEAAIRAGLAASLQLLFAQTQLQTPYAVTASSHVTFDYYQDFTAHVALRWTDGDSRTRVDLEAATVYYLDVANVAGEFSSGLALAHDRTTIALSIAHEITAEAIANASAGVLLYEEAGALLFMHGSLLLGAEARNVELRFSAHGAVDGSTPRFVAGRDFELGVGARFAPNASMNIELDWTHNASIDHDRVQLRVPIRLR